MTLGFGGVNFTTGRSPRSTTVPDGGAHRPGRSPLAFPRSPSGHKTPRPVYFNFRIFRIYSCALLQKPIICDHGAKFGPKVYFPPFLQIFFFSKFHISFFLALLGATVGGGGGSESGMYTKRFRAG